MSMEFRAIIGVPMALCIVLPMSMIKDMSGFRYVSIVSFISLIYTAIVLLSELTYYIKQNWDTATVVPAWFDLNLFNGASITFFSYTC